MALTIGELTGYIDIDARGVDAGVQAAGVAMERLRRDMTADAERAGQQSGQAAGDSLADGVAHGAADAAAAIAHAGSGIVSDAERAGDRAGQGLADGVAHGADEARQEVEQAGDHITEAASEAGDEAGDALGGGLAEGGEAGGEEAGSRAARALKGATGAIVGVVAAIGAAAGAVLIKGITDALDQQKITGKLKASLGATPEEAEKYGHAAGRLYASAVTEDFEGAADVISLTMRAGLLDTTATDAQIAHIAQGVQDLSDTFELDLGQTANAVGQQIKTGLADNAEDALDAMTRGLQLMGPRADDLADTLNEYSVIFRQIGLSSSDAIGLLSQGMKAGARDTDVVADALKEFVLITQGGGKTVDAAFKAIGLSGKDMQKAFIEGGPAARKALDKVFDGLRNMHDPVKRNAAALTLFATKSEDTQKALYALDPSSAAAALGEVGGAADQMGDDLRDNASTKVEIFKRRMQQGLVTYLGDHVIPMIDRLQDRYGGAFRSMVDDAERFWQRTRPRLKGVVDFAQDVAEAFDSGSSKGMAGRVAHAMHEVTDVVEAGVSAVEALWDAHGEEIMRAFHIVWDQIGPTVEGSLRTIKGIIEVITGLINGDWGQFWGGIKDIAFGQLEVIRARIVMFLQLAELAFTTAMGIIWSLVKDAWDAVYDYTTDRLGATVSYVAGIPGRIYNAFLNWPLTQRIAGYWRDAKDATVTGAKNLIDYVTGIPGRISSAIGNLRGLLYNTGLDVVYGIWDGISDAGGWLKQTLTGWATSVIPGPIAKALQIGSPSKLMRDRVGQWIPAGIVEGIKDGEGDVADAMAGLVSVPRVSGVGGAYGASATSAAAGGAAAGGVPRAGLDVTGGDEDLVRLIRKWARKYGGTGSGSVQLAFG